MSRCIAFLRGVSPGKPPMAELRACLEAAGFAAVRTVLASGNVVFDSPQTPSWIESRMAHAMRQAFGKTYQPFVRTAAELRALVEADPFAAHALPAGAKRVVTFRREAIDPALPLPAADGAALLAVRGREAFTAYVPGDAGPVFMTLIERSLGKEQTTRTWETLLKCLTA